MANVITGVALVEAADEISFYFGCVAQATDMGGAGLFVGSSGNASARRVYELRGNDRAAVGEIRAGSMFVADSDMCDVEAIWQQITGRNSASDTAVASRWSAVVVTVVLLIPAASVNSC